MGDLTKNFSADEFLCPCCGESCMHPSFMARLQNLRSEYGKPLGIVEGGGFRCAEYDKSKGAHPEGRAADLTYPREDHFLLLSLALKLGFTGIGDKNRDGKFQLHVDDAQAIQGVRPRPWKWTY